MKEFSERRVQLVFTLATVNVGFAILCAIISQKLDLITLRNFNLLSIVPYILVAYLAKREKLHIARPLYLITINLGLTIISSFVGKPGGVEFVFMFTIGLPYFIFSFTRERLLVIIFALLPIFLWLLLFLTDFNLFTNEKLDPKISNDFIYPSAMSSTVLLVLFQLIYFSILNTRYASNVNNQKEDAFQASNAKSKFLSTMSHEIRTPLNAIIGLSHILADNNPRKDQLENIKALNYSGKILMNLLNNVLDFSKMQSSKIELDNIPTDLFLAVKQIKKIHEAACLRKGITMNLEVDEEIPVVLLDIVRFNQVINNLVSNAIKFTDSGSVTLRIKKNKETPENVIISTEVIDTGLGIPEDKLDEVWEDFTQASSTTNRLYGGTGLGLPIVKSIVNTMGANVFLESEIGKGSRFYFDIELKKATEKELKKEIEQKKYDFDGRKILLVEDNEFNILVGKQILEKEKLIVEVAENGLIAVEKVRNNHFDVVLMDIQMPVMDGYQATKEIRKFNQKIQILALSASVFSEVKENLSQSGMNGFIFKPFNPDDLLFQINNAIHQN
ncbi:MAG: response regulator [Flavobacteriia bacterium]|nr:response regulator [Flavobacteriia bacterium]OIP45391.1 MAG: two-component system sensor histidine kinase/response regulator [Flavobacteriaceae bacterium CG2_30_31_66]PIV96067.1 MAG: two-component system sensor histidine kinase/response regulator [Flavobacteriaceae bacterium CG17_big_fil_post_rev_8_21_14_2_50_31_13]PIX13428.1 MAG: two-component system sensor histidine kinase/response regulator [Flavobacteriaceae bacterium CG_4_8_14_3_um_filter_31_8]PIY13979.1 MAG: two-component system sensor